MLELSTFRAASGYQKLALYLSTGPKDNVNRCHSTYTQALAPRRNHSRVQPLYDGLYAILLTHFPLNRAAADGSPSPHD